jgi:hypothetical protein
MFYLITGAAASGKSTIAHHLKERLAAIECHDYDNVPFQKGQTRSTYTEQWILRALEAQASGRDFLVTAHAPFGELLASPSAVKLDGISACLVDCNDFVRCQRYRNRPQMEEWPLTQDTLCWAVWQRMHAWDPQWEQRVIVKPDYPGLDWERWTGWAKGDPRWDVRIFDNSFLPIDETVKILTDWTVEQKSKHNHLTVRSEWWKH